MRPIADGDHDVDGQTVLADVVDPLVDGLAIFVGQVRLQLRAEADREFVPRLVHEMDDICRSARVEWSGVHTGFVVDNHAGDAALRFIAMYSQLQEICDGVIKHRVRTLMPGLSRLVLEKLERLSDKERIRAMVGLVDDAEGRGKFERVPGVFHELKAVRDSIGHAILMGAIVDDDLNELWVVKGTETRVLKHEELVNLYHRTLWVIEHVLYVGHLVGFATFDGKPYTRRSGASLVDSPPGDRPPTRPLKDPIELWHRIDD